MLILSFIPICENDYEEAPEGARGDRIEHEIFSFIIIIKILFISRVILIMPMRIQIICRFLVIIVMIITINFNNLGIYNLFLHSDLISVRLIILRL